MNDYIDPLWQKMLQNNDLDSFEKFWTLDADWFEPPNYRRGGWSGVSRIELLDEAGQTQVFFLKRQKNHTRKTWAHPITGEPTFISEMRNLRALAQVGVATLELVFFGVRKKKVVLVTKALEGYIPLDKLFENWSNIPRQQKRRLITEIARVVGKMNRAKRVHNALHPKHIFVNLAENKARLIDLEKMRKVPSWGRAMKRDLDSLNRRSPVLSLSDRMWFLKHYFADRVSARQMKVYWAFLEARAKAK